MEPEEERKIREVARKDGRYNWQAYVFVIESLGFAARRRGRPGHVTGRELLEALRDLAIERFGLMAKTVLNSWGVRRTEDIGEIVFRMVDEGLMSKQDSDRREDFSGVFDFDEAFDKGIHIMLED
jgi:uncharacterized repeat protein (TIGR04138 family)